MSGIRSENLEVWESLDIKCLVLEAPSYPCSTQTGQKGEAEGKSEQEYIRQDNEGDTGPQSATMKGI